MPPVVVCEGVVLHQSSLGDSHRLVDVLTREFGRVRALARHARASKKRFGGALDVFAHLRLHLSRSPRGRALEAVEPVALNLGLRQRLDLMSHAATLCNCVRAMAPEEEQAPELFAAVAQALAHGSEHDLPAMVAGFVQVARHGGILPPPMCITCQTPGKAFALHQGAFICLACGPRYPHLAPATLHALMHGEVAADAARAVQDAVLHLVSWHTGKPAQSFMAPF